MRLDEGWLETANLLIGGRANSIVASNEAFTGNKGRLNVGQFSLLECFIGQRVRTKCVFVLFSS